MISKPKTIFCDIDGTLCEYPYTGKMVSFDDEMQARIRYIKNKRELESEVEKKLKAIADRTGEDYDDLYDRYVNSMFSDVTNPLSEE